MMERRGEERRGGEGLFILV
ncbi:unnamed protein product, partial [Vitis vinifera]|uniref:Uncharacterized protein n=1 Tax=Vitis vinifera TaxID=29760 RepID=D7SP36_VITVI